jgi:glucose/arabinose dehydrogenase
MATAPFADADGDAHRCTDWEIVSDAGPVWTAPCVTGALKVHIHLGDGGFTNDRTALDHGTAYLLRVRHRSDGGDAGSEWSDWSVRTFRTTFPPPAPPLSLRDVLTSPAPRWVDNRGDPTLLPIGAALRLEAPDGERLIEIRGGTTGMTATEDQPLHDRVAVRVVLQAGGGMLRVEQSQLTIHGEDGAEHTIYLPGTTLAPSFGRSFWVSANGSTHTANPDDRAPDFSEIVRGAPVPWTAIQKGFRIEPVAGGFQLPVNIAFVPHPREDPGSPLFYVTELYGTVKVVTRGGEVRDYATNLLNFNPLGPFPGSGEIGLTGITVEPYTGDVIVTAVYKPAGRPPGARILRLHSEDGGLTASRVDTILEMPDEEQVPSHQISDVSIGFDGMLYVHMGDAHYAPLAQNMLTRRGKILRMNLDGQPPPDNPFYDATDGIGPTDYIFALGFRNPFGGSWRAADGMLYEVENGPTIDRLARVERGRNYGWDGTEESMTIGAVCNFPPGSAPVNLAFVQRERFDGSGFPEQKLDHAFVTESGPTWATGTPSTGKRISEVAIGRDGVLVSGPDAFVRYDGTGKATVAGIAAGPDGLYFTSLYKDWGYELPFDRGAEVFRVRWTGYAAFGMAFAADDPLRVELTDRSPVADDASWHWDFGDGATSAERNPTHRYARSGTYIVHLTIVSGSDTLSVAKRVHVTDEGSGALAEYYASPDLEGFRGRALVPAIDLEWTEAPFSARWRARIRARFSETYRFIVRTNGTARMQIDGEEVLDETVELAAGEDRELVLEYVHPGGTGSLQLLWESETQEREVIPRSVLFAPVIGRQRSVRK